MQSFVHKKLTKCSVKISLNCCKRDGLRVMIKANLYMLSSVRDLRLKHSLYVRQVPNGGPLHSYVLLHIEEHCAKYQLNLRNLQQLSTHNYSATINHLCVTVKTSQAYHYNCK